MGSVSAATSQLCDTRLLENSLPVIPTWCLDTAGLWSPAVQNIHWVRKTCPRSPSPELSLISLRVCWFRFLYFSFSVVWRPGRICVQAHQEGRQQAALGAVPAFCQLLCVWSTMTPACGPRWREITSTSEHGVRERASQTSRETPSPPATAGMDRLGF